jgi:hypothetical protein
MPNIRRIETTTADFEQGTLTDVVAVNDGLELAEIAVTDYDNFDRTSIGSEWVEQNPTYPRWSISNNQLKCSQGSTAGYNSLWWTKYDIAGENIVIEYDVFFTNVSKWGGFDYRGVGVDVNTTR